MREMHEENRACAPSTFPDGLVASCMMPESIQRRSPIVCLVGLFVALSLSVHAGAEDQRQAWDQARVTEMAAELEKTLEEIHEQSLKAPPQQTALQQRERDAAQGAIRRARDRSQDYARRTRAGWTREESEPYFRAVVEEVEAVWDTAGDAVPAENAKPLIDRLQRILDDLRALYAAPSTPRPGTLHERTGDR